MTLNVIRVYIRAS